MQYLVQGAEKSFEGAGSRGSWVEILFRVKEDRGRRDPQPSRPVLLS